VDISIDINTEDLTRALERGGDNVTSAIRIGMKEGLQIIVRQAKSKHRFKTRSGQAERSILQSVESSGLSGKVYLDRGIAVYSPSLHEGWGSRPADPFLYEAAEEKQREVVAEIERGIQDAINQAGLG